MLWYNVRQIMGYQTNDTRMCPWPKQLLNIPFTWVVFGVYLVVGLTCISHHELSILSSWVKATPSPKTFQSICNWKIQPLMGHFKMSVELKPSFQLLKSLFLCILPCEFFITLGQLSQGFGNLTIQLTNYWL